MTVYAGQIHSYVQTVPQKRTVTDRIIMTEPVKIALVAALGLSNESKFAFANAPGRVYEWLHDTYADVADAVNTTALTSDTTLTSITVDNGALFHVGDVIQVDNEYMWVSAISSNVLTVTRGFGGTQATHANDSVVYIRTNARLEGAAASDSPFTEVTSDYNYSQIFQHSIEVSRTDARLPMYGIANVVDREIDKHMEDLLMHLARTPYYGQRKVGSSSTPRSMGGFDTWISTNLTTLTSSPALLEKNVQDSIQKCFDGGGEPSLLVCNSWAKRKIADWYAPYVKTEIDEKRGGVTIENIVSPLGLNLAILVDRNCPTTSLYVLDESKLGYITIDDFFYEELGKTKDTAPGGFGQIVGEYGFVLAHEAAHAKIAGFSTSI